MRNSPKKWVNKNYKNERNNHKWSAIETLDKIVSETKKKKSKKRALVEARLAHKLLEMKTVKKTKAISGRKQIKAN